MGYPQLDKFPAQGPRPSSPVGRACYELAKCNYEDSKELKKLLEQILAELKKQNK